MSKEVSHEDCTFHNIPFISVSPFFLFLYWLVFVVSRSRAEVAFVGDFQAFCVCSPLVNVLSFSLYEDRIDV